MQMWKGNILFVVPSGCVRYGFLSKSVFISFFVCFSGKVGKKTAHLARICEIIGC